MMRLMSTVEQIIKTTDGHPFWVVTDTPDLERAARSVVDENGFILYHENVAPGLNGFWVEAKDLKVGDVFLGASGELSMLTNIVRVEQSGGIAVFNFTVEGNHNYFILAKEYEFGQSCILVHNMCAKVTDAEYKVLVDRARAMNNGMRGKYADLAESLRIDSRNLTPSEIPHVHFLGGDNIALNLDGTWKHLPPTNWAMPRKAQEYIESFFKPAGITISSW